MVLSWGSFFFVSLKTARFGSGAVTTDPGGIPDSFARDDGGRPRFAAGHCIGVVPVANVILPCKFRVVYLFPGAPTTISPGGWEHF